MTWLLYQWTRRFGSFIAWCSLCVLIDTQRSSLDVYSVCSLTVSGIGAVVKVVGSHPCGWGSIPGNSCSFLIVSLSKSLALCFMCSDQNVKYWIPRGFPTTSSLLLDYHVKQYTHTVRFTYFKLIRATPNLFNFLICLSWTKTKNQAGQVNAQQLTNQNILLWAWMRTLITITNSVAQW